MKRIAIASFALLFVFAFSSAAKAETLPPAGDELDMEIQKEMKKEDAKKKSRGAQTKEEVPPISMVFVKGGCFDMGDSTGDGDDDERPAHKVCLTDFYMGETEVTQALWEAVMGYNPSRHRDPNKPVHGVSYHRARQFIRRLNELTKGFYRLPTEAEWEYAARSGGRNERWPGVDNEAELGNYAWYADNSDEEIHLVKQKKPNGIGLYDMGGNVWEWTEDNFDFEYYQVSPKKDPLGPEVSYWRVTRGGSSGEEPYKVRSSFRYGLEPDRGMPAVGFRLAE